MWRWQRNGVKYSEGEIKNDNFTVKLSFLFNSENSVIHSYLYNKVCYFCVSSMSDNKHI